MSATIWVDCTPENGVEGFSERSNERRQVFEDATRRLGSTELPPVVWAFSQIGHLEQVKTSLQTKFSWKGLTGDVNSEAIDAVRLWSQRPDATHMAATDTTPKSGKRSHSTAFSNPTPSSPLRRSQVTAPVSVTRTRSGKSHGGPEYSVRRANTIAKLCKKRDGSLCVVSRIGATDACHVYPWCAFGGKDPERVDNFWQILQMFWPEDKVGKWRAKIFRDGMSEQGTETVENMVTLTSTLHRFHSGGAFALRPLRMSTDKTQLELEFHWLVVEERDKNELVALSSEPKSSRGRTDSGKGRQFVRFDDAGPIPLVSGTRITMTTDDPIEKPLPDPGLLELQWHLQRILAMSGAAGWKEEEFDNDEPGTGAAALTTIPQWLDDQPSVYSQRRSPSPIGSEEIVDGAYE